jgi:hypothetical protein
LIAVVANVSTHRVWLLFGPISVARALGVKDFTKARVKAEKSFIYFPKEERARCYRQHLLCGTIGVRF